MIRAAAAHQLADRVGAGRGRPRCGRRSRGAPRRPASARRCGASARRPRAAGRRCDSRCSTTCRSVSATKPRLVRSPASPASAPIANEPAYHTGCEQAGAAVELAHALLAPGEVVGLVAGGRPAGSRGPRGSRAVRAWPWYRAWAAISPAWLTRIRPAAWRRARGFGHRFGRRAGRVGAGGHVGRGHRAQRPVELPDQGGRRGSRAGALARMDHYMCAAPREPDIPVSPGRERAARPRAALDRRVPGAGGPSAGNAPALQCGRPYSKIRGSLQDTQVPWSLPMSTVFARSETVRRDWYVVDASGKTLGRLATQLAMRLRGKHKPEYTPARRHRRPHHRAQRREDPRHRRQARATRSTTGTPAPSAASRASRSGRCWPSTRSARSSSRSRACCRRTRSAAPCSRSCTCSRAPSTRTPRSSPSRSTL